MYNCSQRNSIKVQWKLDIKPSAGTCFYDKTNGKEVKNLGLPVLERNLMKEKDK